MRGISYCGGKAISGPCNGIALRDENLRPHQIHARDDFGDRVLDLDARVDLDEKPFLLVKIVKKLDRAGVVVIDSPRHAAPPPRTIPSAPIRARRWTARSR